MFRTPETRDRTTRSTLCALLSTATTAAVLAAGGLAGQGLLAPHSLDSAHADSASFTDAAMADKKATSVTSKTAAKKRREWPYRTAVLLMALAGIAVTLFPVAATYYNNWHAVRYANSTTSTQGQDGEANAQALARARQYNQAMPLGAVSDPWTGTDQTKNPAYQEYLKQLNDTSAMARLRVPSISLTLAVLHGTDEVALHQGAGHMFGTSLPVGGSGTHAALAAHRGLPNLTGFDRLPELKNGAEFFVDVYGETLAYRISSSCDWAPPAESSVRGWRWNGRSATAWCGCGPTRFP